MRTNTVQALLFRVLRRAGESMNAHLFPVQYLLCGRRRLDRPASESQVIRLRANEVLRLTRTSRVSHLEVRRGTVWLTGTPARGDVLLRDGDRFVLKDTWPFVVQAIGKAEIILLPGPIENCQSCPRNDLSETINSLRL